MDEQINQTKSGPMYLSLVKDMTWLSHATFMWTQWQDSWRRV